MALSQTQGYIMRTAIATSVATVTLMTGAMFTIKAPVTGLSPAGATVARFVTGSGVQVGTINDLGQGSFSGGVVTDGAMSGASTLTLSPLGNTPTLKILCPKAGGVIGVMTVTATGTVLKTCN